MKKLLTGNEPETMPDELHPTELEHAGNLILLAFIAATGGIVYVVYHIISTVHVRLW